MNKVSLPESAELNIYYSSDSYLSLTERGDHLKTKYVKFPVSGEVALNLLNESQKPMKIVDIADTALDLGKLRLKEVSTQASRYTEFYYERSPDAVFSIDQLGSGVVQSIALISIVKEAHNYDWIGLENPETSIHPLSVKWLAEFLPRSLALQKGMGKESALDYRLKRFDIVTYNEFFCRGVYQGVKANSSRESVISAMLFQKHKGFWRTIDLVEGEMTGIGED